MSSLDRFDIIRPIGEGGQGQTYLARDTQTGEHVALKRLALRLVDNWKALELFEREGAVLQNLSHPQIPTFITTFVEDTDEGPRFYLVQEYVEGDSLAEQIEAGVRWDVEHATSFLRSMLGVLTYLGSLRPPIVHRDIKPANIIERNDGTWELVDFGAVRAIVPAESGGSTVVGTTGYLPPEQVLGRAEPASDQYALGATVLHMMSGLHPGDLADGGLTLEIREHVDAHAGFIDFLDRMLSPFPEDRFESASAALDALDALESTTAMVGGDDTTDVALDHGDNRRQRMELVRQAARLDLPATIENNRVCFSVWSPLMPYVTEVRGEGRMVGAAWCAMAASAFLITGGWIVSGLVAALLSFGLILGLAGHFTQVVLGENALVIMRGSSLFNRIGARLDYDRIDDFVSRDSDVLVLAGVEEFTVPMANDTEAARLTRLLRSHVLRASERRRPLAKPVRGMLED